MEVAAAAEEEEEVVQVQVVEVVAAGVGTGCARGDPHARDDPRHWITARRRECNHRNSSPCRVYLYFFIGVTLTLTLTVSVRDSEKCDVREAKTA